MILRMKSVGRFSHSFTIAIDLETCPNAAVLDITIQKIATNWTLTTTLIPKN